MPRSPVNGVANASFHIRDLENMLPHRKRLFLS